LKNIRYELHKEWLIEDKEYFKKVLNFIRFLQSFSGGKPFIDFYQKTIDIYKELRKEKDFQNKMKLHLKNLGIDEEEREKNDG
jgi:hypothetical protein